MQVWRWGWNIGASLFFVPLLLKNWRVYYIFHNPTKHKIVSLTLSMADSCSIPLSPPPILPSCMPIIGHNWLEVVSGSSWFHPVWHYPPDHLHCCAWHKAQCSVHLCKYCDMLVTVYGQNVTGLARFDHRRCRRHQCSDQLCKCIKDLLLLGRMDWA